MRSTALLLLTLCCSTIVGTTQTKRASDDEKAMTAGDLQEICIGSSPEAKAACRFYLLGITQGLSMGMSIADGKTDGRRPCIPENLSDSAIELAVKMKMGQDLMVYPDDRKLDASGLVSGILVSTFPCRKPN
jgi:hypothetical protein